MPTLEGVIEHYAQGGSPDDPTLDPLITGFELTENESQALVAFLQSLTGDNVEQLVGDALAAPIGDPG